ncbi:purF [Symbiodinium natans]|uniref:PurF protein n=1 Tax=Symbiodinium natans TaxID=878477 RepID=A0A812HED7_9DINO|nr:purF [Symbiodinium natans]
MRLHALSIRHVRDLCGGRQAGFWFEVVYESIRKEVGEQAMMPLNIILRAAACFTLAGSCGTVTSSVPAALQRAMRAMLSVIATVLPALTASASLLQTRVNSTHRDPGASIKKPVGMISSRTFDAPNCENKGKEWKDFCGVPKSSIEKTDVIKFDGVEQRGICSQYHQDRYLDQIFRTIGTTNTFFVEFGARRPEVLNSAHFRMNCGWSGLLMDGAPGGAANGACPDCPGQELLDAPDDAPVRLRQAFMTADNINDHFEKNKVPCEFDLLTVDVDKNDYWLVKALDFSRFRPRVVAVEFSSYFKSDEKKVNSYIEDAVWHMWDITGASLAALNDLMRAKGYQLVAQVAGEHGLWVLGSEMNEEDKGMEVPETVEESWQWQGRLEGKPAENFEDVEAPCEDFGCATSDPSCPE